MQQIGIGYGKQPDRIPDKADRVGKDDHLFVFWDTPKQRNPRVFCLFHTQNSDFVLREFLNSAWTMPDLSLSQAHQSYIYETVEDGLAAIQIHIPERN